jgi:hypothetical protein
VHPGEVVLTVFCGRWSAAVPLPGGTICETVLPGCWLLWLGENKCALQHGNGHTSGMSPDQSPYSRHCQPLGTVQTHVSTPALLRLPPFS